MRLGGGGVIRTLLNSAVVAPALLLDTLSATPILAYSTRKLSSAYAGKALQIQSGVDVGFDGSGNLDTSGLSGTNSIKTWYDQVGANNAANATGVQQPIIQTAGVLDIQAGHVWAGGTAGTGLPNSLVQASPYSVAILARLDGSAANGVIIGTQFAGGHLALGSNGSSAWLLANANNTVTGGVADTNVHTLIAIITSGTIQLLVDGALVLSGATTADTISSGFDLWDFGSSVHIGEVIVMPGAISGGDQTKIKNSWISYWGAPP